jgi:protein gp37
MGATEIGWTDFSTNPFRAHLAESTATKGGYASGVGHYCEKISAGCKNCYSSALQPKFGLPAFQEQRGGAVESFFDASKLGEVLRRKKPTKIFWCDMTDMFGSWVPFKWVAACFGVMAATPQHTHQVLTKRPERALEFFRWLGGMVGTDVFTGRQMVAETDPLMGCSMQASRVLTEKADMALMLSAYQKPSKWPLPNVHLGVSIEDQQRADERIPLLLKCPATVRWISAEPLLGPVRLDDISDGGAGVLKPLAGLHWVPGSDRDGNPGMVLSGGKGAAIGWVVVGGESGAGHRPVDPAWVDSIVAQCTAAGVPVFVKQDSGPKPGRQGRLSAETWARKEFPQ